MCWMFEQSTCKTILPGKPVSDSTHPPLIHTMTTTLQQMKGIEDKREKARILKVLSRLKEIARRVQEDKERCTLYLQEVCKDVKEQKQVIDWINSLDDVALSEEAKADLQDEIKQSLVKEKKEIERKMDEKPETYWTTGLNALTSGTVATSNLANYASTQGVSLGQYTVSSAQSGFSIN